MATKITWLGHATFLIETPAGKRVLIDPWVKNNPVCPDKLKKLGSVDLILITHGHGDHIGDAVEIAKELRPPVVAIYETALWLGSKGVENVSGANKGGSQVISGIRIHMVHADHSCGIQDGDHIVYGGEAVGYVLEIPDGPRVYHAGDTALFGDIRLIGELYRPTVAMLPIGDLYTMSPREAAIACQWLPSASQIFPMHWGTFPPLIGTPTRLRELTREIPGLLIHDLKPGDTRTV